MATPEERIRSVMTPEERMLSVMTPEERTGSARQPHTKYPLEEESIFVQHAKNFPSSVVTDVVEPLLKKETYSGMAKLAESLTPGGWISSAISGGNPLETVSQWPQIGAAMVSPYTDEGGLSLEKAKETFTQHPATIWMDLASALTGIGGLAKGTKVGAIASKTGELANPLGWPGKVASGARQAVGTTGLPESIYARVMKIPPGSVNQEMRSKILTTLTKDEGLRLGKNLPSKMSSTISEIDSNITDTLQNVVAQRGSSVPINVVENALDSIKPRFANRPNPQAYYDIIDQVKDEFMNHSFVNQGNVALDKANQLKKGTYTEISDYYKKKQSPETGRAGIQNQVEAVSKDTAARALRDAIVNHPDVPDILKEQLGREAGLLNARRWVERAVNRGQNIDPIRLSGMLYGMLVQGGMPAAMAYQVALSQPAMSQIAIWLKRGSQTTQKLGELGQPTSLVGFQGSKGIKMEQ